MSRTSTASSSPRSDPVRARTAATLRALGIRPDRSLGQSFLVDPFVADAEAALVEVRAGAPVVEIGPGLGALTEALLRRGIGPLTLIERDQRLARYLRREFGERVSVVEGDARTLAIPQDSSVVGNLPFSVATPLLLRFLDLGVPQIVALVQSEVAERLLAAPGSGAYGRLTLMAALRATVEGFLPVPAAAFEPVPRVGGRVVVLRRREGPLPVPEPDAFEALTRALFHARRKQLKNLLGSVVPVGTPLTEVADRADWPSDWATRRPEELPPEAFFRLAVVLGSLRGGTAVRPKD